MFTCNKFLPNVKTIFRYCCKCKVNSASASNEQPQAQGDALEGVREDAGESEPEKLSRSSSYVVIEIQDSEAGFIVVLKQ